MKTKDFALEVKAVSDVGTFEGYASVFGIRDSYNEMTMPGAFTGSLRNHWPAMLWSHRSDAPIGIWKDIAEDKKGLWVKGEFNLETQLGKETHSLTKQGAVKGLSIGYREIEVEEPKDRADPRKLLELGLMEVSVVTFPALRMARIDVVKSAEVANLYERIAAGDRLSEREWEAILKAEPFGFSNKQAERAVRVNLKRGQGEPDATAEPVAKQVRAALREALATFKKSP